MKALILFTLPVLLLAASDQQAPKPAGVVVKQLEIPAGAVSDEDGYHYTDAQGKKWLYRKTPFGVARLEDPGAKPASKAASSPDDYVNATEDGDAIRFERPGPFGTYRWTRKKSELSASERAIWERSRDTGKKN